MNGEDVAVFLGHLPCFLTNSAMVGSWVGLRGFMSEDVFLKVWIFRLENSPRGRSLLICMDVTEFLFIIVIEGAFSYPSMSPYTFSL